MVESPARDLQKRGPPAITRANPLVSSRGGGIADPRLSIRPSASEPALPEEERGPVERHRAAGPGEEPYQVQDPERPHRRELRTTEPVHSMSVREHNSLEPGLVHSREPAHRRWEPVLRSHSRCIRRNRRHSRRIRSRIRGDDGNGDGDSNHRNHHSLHNVPTQYPGRR
jgi:hypothetical protein